MAKTSVKARQRKREKMVAQFAAKREELKKAGDWKALDELPKNSSRVRLKNRCQLPVVQKDMSVISAYRGLPCVTWHLMEKFRG